MTQGRAWNWEIVSSRCQQAFTNSSLLESEIPRENGVFLFLVLARALRDGLIFAFIYHCIYWWTAKPHIETKTGWGEMSLDGESDKQRFQNLHQEKRPDIFFQMRGLFHSLFRSSLDVAINRWATWLYEIIILGKHSHSIDCDLPVP